MWCGRAARSRSDLCVRVGKVKRGEDLRQLVAEHGQIDAASRAVELVTVLGLRTFRDIRAADRQVKISADHQQRVTNTLGVQTTPVHSRQESIVRIDGGLRVRLAAQLIGPREHETANQLLHRQSIFHKLCREEIEQFRMGRIVACHAEVVDGAHQALSVQPIPDSIHHHSRCQRIARIGNPFGQLHPTALVVGNDKRLIASNNLQESTRNYRARIAD